MQVAYTNHTEFSATFSESREKLDSIIAALTSDSHTRYWADLSQA
jgi:hypothetical protein